MSIATEPRRSGSSKVWKSIARQELEEWVRSGRAVAQVLSLDKIRLDHDYQARVAMDMAHVDALCGYIDMAEGDPIVALAHIVVFKDKKTGRLIVADGFHRVMAYRKKRLKAIRAWVIVSENAEHEARLFCVSANLEMSLPTSREDRAKAMTILLSDPVTFEYSDPEIARRCGISKLTAKRFRNTFCLQKGIDLPDSTVAFSVNGKPTRMKYKYSATAGPTSHMYNSGGKRNTPFFRGVVSGQTYNLGSDKRLAEEKFKKIITEVGEAQEARKQILSNNGTLINYLIARKVRATYISESFLGGIRIDGALCTFCLCNSFENMLAQVGRLLLLSEVVKPEDRLLVVICDRSAMTTDQRRLEKLVLGLSRKIEFMTPEEVVEHFGPNGGANNVNDQSPTD